MTKEQERKSENEHKVRETQLEQKAMSRLRLLAANIMRIASGTGKLQELESQLLEAAACFQEYRNHTSVGIDPAAASEALEVSSEYGLREALDDLERLRIEAECMTVCGALGVAAWHLDGHPRGLTTHNEMNEGQKRMEEFRRAVSNEAQR